MRILLVVHGLSIGGAEIMVSELARAHVRNGHDVMVVSLSSGSTSVADEIRAAGIEVIGLNKSRGFDPACVRRLRAAIRAWRPDVIHSHLPVLPYVVPASAGTQAKLVHTFHNVADRETRSSTKRALNRILLRLGRVSAVALTSHAAESVSATYGLPLNRIAIVPNGRQLAPYRLAGERRRELDTFRVLHVGRFHAAKNHEALLEAFHRFVTTNSANARLTLVGDGELLTHIRQKCDELGLSDSVHFAGAIKDVAPYYEAADVFVLPSVYEGLPMALIEAMASGLPVVCSDLATLHDIVTPGADGYLEDPASAEFVGRLVQLWRDPALRARLGAAASARAEAFDVDTMARGYEQVYDA